ncbi:indolethylamine N-methyltransferase-like [Lissotriton helveticus]
MASSYDLKELHDRYLEPILFMETYIGKEATFIEDTSMQIFPLLCKTFSSGVVKGEMLIVLSVGPFFQWALPASEYFTDIIFASSVDKCISEVEKWRTNAPGAINWSHAAKMVCEIEGNRETWIEKETIFRTIIKQVLKYDVSKSNPLSPTVLPQADCLLLPHCLECHVTDKDGFCSALKNVSSLLKKGGYLILIICSEATYFMVGSFKFPHLCIEEGFVKKVLGDAGYDIEELLVLPRQVQLLHDVADYHSFLYVVARKQ